MANQRMYGALLHLGMNMWTDRPYPRPLTGEYQYEIPTTLPPEVYKLKKLARTMGGCKDFLNFDEATFHAATEHLAQKGMNLVMIDVGEGLVYPSHPELGVKGSWSVEELRAEIARLRDMGFEVIPKLNFSACHDTWLKDYHRMVSTSRYYEVCRDVINDVAEIFDRPRLFHLGYDEETAAHQRDHLYVVCRQGDLWWHDFLWFVGVVEKAGCRPWIWSDYVWNHRDEFLKRMPKSVLQSNWYYGASFDKTDKNGKARTYVAAYEWLDRAGFEQVPTGSNFSCDTNFDGTVKFCDANCDRSLVKGYMMAPWTRTFAIHERKSNEAIDQMAAVIKARA